MTSTKMKTTVVISVAALLVIGAALLIVKLFRPAPDIQGTWLGTVSLGGWGVHAGEEPRTRLILKIVKINGAFQAAGDSVDQGIKDAQVDIFTYHYPRIHAEILASHDSYEATVDRAGTKISGKWTENKISRPLVFTRTTNPPPFPEPLTREEFTPRAGSALQGFWTGTIQIGKSGLSVNIKIAESPDGVFRGDFYCPPQGPNRQPTTVTYDGTTVKLMPMAGYGMFQGELRNDGKEMAGHWIQNGQQLPTTFALEE